MLFLKYFFPQYYYSFFYGIAKIFKFIFMLLSLPYKIRFLREIPIIGMILTTLNKIYVLFVNLFIPKGSNYQQITSEQIKSPPTNVGVWYSVICFMGFISIALGQTCTSHNVISGNLTSCVIAGNLKTCKLSFSSNVFISNPYDSVCLTIIDPDNKNLVLDLNIRAQVSTKRSLQRLYVTSDWEMDSKSDVVCNQDTIFNHNVYCPDSGCLSFNPRDPYVTIQKSKDAKETLFSGITSLDKPGISSCISIGSLPECAFGPNTCVYYRIVLNAIGDPIVVYKLFSKEAVVNISINAFDGSNTTNIPITKIGNTYFVGNDQKVTIKNIGVINPFDDFQENLFIAVHQGVAYTTSASPLNVPTSNLLGDFQASTSGGLKDKNQGIANWKDFTVGYKEGSGLQITSPMPGFKDFLANRKSFPMNINGNRYFFKDNYLMSHLSNQPNVELLINTQTPINVVYRVVSVDPNCNFVSASGTINSDSGCSLTLSCKSNSDSGIIHLSVSDSSISLKTKVINLSQNFQNFIVNFIISKTSNSFYIKVEGTENSQNIKVSFTAHIPGYVKNDTYVEKNTHDDNSQDDFPSPGKVPDFFDSNSFFDFSDIKKSIIFWVSIIIVFIITLSLLIFIVKKFVIKQIKFD